MSVPGLEYRYEFTAEDQLPVTTTESNEFYYRIRSLLDAGDTFTTTSSGVNLYGDRFSIDILTSKTVDGRFEGSVDYGVELDIYKRTPGTDHEADRQAGQQCAISLNHQDIDASETTINGHKFFGYDSACLQLELLDAVQGMAKLLQPIDEDVEKDPTAVFEQAAIQMFADSSHQELEEIVQDKLEEADGYESLEVELLEAIRRLNEILEGLDTKFHEEQIGMQTMPDMDDKTFADIRSTVGKLIRDGSDNSETKNVSATIISTDAYPVASVGIKVKEDDESPMLTFSSITLSNGILRPEPSEVPALKGDIRHFQGLLKMLQ